MYCVLEPGVGVIFSTYYNDCPVNSRDEAPSAYYE